jgi:hypothetical protein
MSNNPVWLKPVAVAIAIVTAAVLIAGIVSVPSLAETKD